MAKYIISSLEFVGLSSSLYIGYKYGNQTKQNILTYSPYCNSVYTSSIKPFFKKETDENIFFNLIGGLSGVCLSWYLKAWIIFIPITIYETNLVDKLFK